MSAIILTVIGIAIIGLISVLAITIGVAILRFAIWGITLTGIIGVIVTIGYDIDSPYTATLWLMAIGGILTIALIGWVRTTAARN
ncbi:MULTISPECIES: hypothetical protein [Brevibacterium]|uniref:hypothetical protein n=1 Tax=Brevibacterium TaxID=1696 RepID=UPI001420326B|nr:hypothetical protein [Brevibacterium limosum]